MKKLLAFTAALVMAATSFATTALADSGWGSGNIRDRGDGISIFRINGMTFWGTGDTCGADGTKYVNQARIVNGGGDIYYDIKYRCGSNRYICVSEYEGGHESCSTWTRNKPARRNQDRYEQYADY